MLSDYNEYSNVEALINKYPFYSKAFFERVRNKVNFHLSKTSNVELAEILLMDVNDNFVSLKSIVEDYAYLDFWATWCVPCIAEDSYLEKLAQTDLENIKFAKISLDKDKSRWKKFVNKKDLKNVDNYYIPAGFDSSLAKLWNIKGIPRFVVIDKNMKVLQYEANRPSDSKLNDYLKTL